MKKDQWGVALVHSIRERGSERDILELVRSVRADPCAADAVRRAIPGSQVFCSPEFFKMYLEKLYGN